jgi:hypothetical protein
MNVIEYAIQRQEDKQRKREAEILRAVCSVDLDPERRQQLLDALRREGLLS